MRKSFIVLITLVIMSFTINPAEASLKCAFGKKYEVPPMSESYIQTGSTSKRALNPKSIKVLAWNILKGYRKSFPTDFPRMAKGQDLLLLQEGYLSDVVAETFENMHNFQFDFAVSFIYKKENYTPTGTVMGSSVPPLEFKNIRTPDLEPFICTPKTMTSAYYEVDGSSEDLLVLNIHGMNFTKISSFKRQVLSAVEVIQAHDGPVIFAGDFNSHGKRRKKWLKKILGLVGMHDIGFRNDKRKKFVVGELDYFFVKDLAVKDAWTEKNKSSDHAAMFAELQLAN